MDPPLVRLLPKTSLAWTVMLVCEPAVPAGTLAVDCGADAPDTVTLTTALSVIVMPLSVPVIVAVPTVVVDRVAVYVPFELSPTALRVPSVVARSTVPPDAVRTLLLASRAWTVTVAWLPAVTLPTLVVICVVAALAVAGTVVIVALVPVLLPVVAVTVVAVPETVCVVSVIVATPLAFVADVAAENEPLPSDFVQVTVCPAVATALLLASDNCAVITTPAPAAGELVAAVTMYLLAAAASGVIDGLLPVLLPVVAVTTCVAPTAALTVKTTVAIPLEFVVDVADANDPPPVLLHVTIWPVVATELPFASASCALIVTFVPTVGFVLVVVTRYCVAGAAVNVTSALFAIASELTVPATVAVADVVPEVKTATYRPLVESPTELSEPAVVESATVEPPNAMLLLFASLS